MYDAVIIAVGGEFLLKHVKVKDELRCYFAVTEDGLPMKLQRKPYTECFYVIGLIELYRATSDIKYQVYLIILFIYLFLLQINAEEMLQQLIEWICVDDSGLGMPVLSGAPSTRQLGYPMILLNVLTEFCGNDTKMREKYSKQFKWSTEAILKHVITTSYLDRLLLLLLFYSMMETGYMNML